MEHDDLLASAVMEEILALANKYPFMPLKTAVQRAMPGHVSGYVVGPPQDYELLGKWAYDHVPAVKENILNETIILGIKELRAHTGCGLKEAKDAVLYVKHTLMNLPESTAPSPKGQSLKHLYKAASEEVEWDEAAEVKANYKYTATDAKITKTVLDHYGLTVTGPTSFTKISDI